MNIGLSDFGASSDSDSSYAMNDDGDDYNETVFQLDDDFNNDQNFPKQIPECSNNDNNNNNKKKKAPLGRLRRRQIKPFTKKHEIQLPARFIEGFKHGAMYFNIPGVMEEYLEPSNSTDVKINLTTPELYTRLSYHGDLHAELFERYGYDLEAALNSESFGLPRPEQPPVGRFGLSVNNSSEHSTLGGFDYDQTTNQSRQFESNLNKDQSQEVDELFTGRFQQLTTKDFSPINSHQVEDENDNNSNKPPCRFFNFYDR